MKWRFGKPTRYLWSGPKCKWGITAQSRNQHFDHHPYTIPLHRNTQYVYIYIRYAVQYILKYTHVKIRTRMKPPGSVPIDKGTKTNKNETEETCIMLFEREVPTENPKLRTWSDSQAWEILATGFYAETDGNSVAEVWGERGAGLLNEDIPGKNQYASHLSLLYWLHCSQAFPIKPFWNVLSLELDALKRSTSQRTT